MNLSCDKQNFPKSIRLQNAKDYQNVFRNPVRSSDAFFTILACRNSSLSPRLGLVIAKKVLSKAVQRNRVKRHIRESFRRNQQSLQGLDFVVLAKKGLQDMPNDEIQRSLYKHWERLIKKCAES